MALIHHKALVGFPEKSASKACLDLCFRCGGGSGQVLCGIATRFESGAGFWSGTG